MSNESEFEPDVKQFGAEIRRRREAMGVTVEKLAELSKLSPSRISAIETGEREPVLSEVFALTEGLGVNPAVLFGALDARSGMAEQAGRQFEKVEPDVQNAMLSFLHTVMKKEPK